MPLRADAARLHTTTELQAFALIVTAEPYFAVTQPSDVVVMENVVGAGTNGTVAAVQAHYELLQRGSYLRDQQSALTIAPLEPGTPLDLAEARNAIALARIAGAHQFAVDSYTKATRLLAAAVLAYPVQQKIPLTAVDTAGFGETRPIASNATAPGRHQNRRVELVVTGESIGRAPNPSRSHQ